MLQHGCVRPCLVKVSPDRVGAVSTNDHASHATLVQGLGDLPKVILGVFGVRVNDDDLPDVLLADLVNGRKEHEVLFATGSRRVRSVHVNDGGRASGHHRHRCEHHFKHVPVNRGASWRG